MKRKISAFVLVLVLVLIPSIILATSTKYTKTEKVTYNPCTVAIDDINLTDTIKIGDKVYVSTNSVADILGKSHSVDKKGNISIDKQYGKHDIGKGTWGDTKADVINAEGRQPDLNQTDKLTYQDAFNFGLTGTIYYMFNNDKLNGGMITYDVSDEDGYADFEYLCNELYKHFDGITSKELKVNANCPSNLDVTEAISQGYAYRKATFLNDRTSVTLWLDNKADGSLIISIIYEKQIN